MHPNGASKNKDDQAIFSKDGPYLISPALTNKPSVIPKIYKLKIIEEENQFKNRYSNKGKLIELQAPIQSKSLRVQ